MAEPKWRPILFTGPMVCKILAGEKTQTRRIIKPQPSGSENFPPNDFCDKWYFRDGYYAAPENDIGRYVRCPFGNTGDYLWVKERTDVIDRGVPPNGWQPTVVYYADKSERNIPDEKSIRPRMVSSIHMPRRHSRLSLRIVRVGVERLQSISPADCEREGILRDHTVLFTWTDQRGERTFRGLRAQYARLWESIHGPGSWALSPYVWVIDFEREP